MRYNPPMTARPKNLAWLSKYAAQIAGIEKRRGVTEASYRSPIETMLRDAAGEFSLDVDILHEPEREKNIGAPDFLVSAKSGGVVGYVECKKPNADLVKLAGGKQMQKYRALSENLLLTDSFRWLHLLNGDICRDVRIGKKSGSEAQREFADALRFWMEASAEKVGDSGQLASALAQRCAMLRDGLRRYEYEDESLSALHGLWRVFQNLLNSDLTFADFADVLAQTLVYSLLLAKLKAPAGARLDFYDAPRYIPGNYAVIRELAGFLQKLEDEKYANIKWITGDILAVINGIDTVALAETMAYTGDAADDDDPYLHFYEPFLGKYDPDLRERRGVYYTPQQVVKFIVRAVHDLLRHDFKMGAGLAEQGVTALDFATGTGTFMLEMARKMFEGKNKKQRNMLVHKHFLPNFSGFELMTSPYVISHMKLSQFLTDNGVELQKDERVQIFLTNTLERIAEQAKLSLMPSLVEEAKLAQGVKDSEVLVIVGNPPYSGFSQNKGEWITGLIEAYKYVDGEHFGERRHWLQDDYVKFVRFAQWKMEDVKRGIVAVITNHGFLDNPTFRGMRQSLMNSFDALYFLDLHGNTSNYERPPKGGADDNVFDIRQGVAISLLVKNPDAKKKGVFHADLWGVRKKKYKFCMEKDISSVKWRKLSPATPDYFFVPRNRKADADYRSLRAVTEIFSSQVTGIVTARDHFAIDADKKELLRRMRAFIVPGDSDDEVAESLCLKNTRGWKISEARKEMAKIKLPAYVKKVAYRPFDTRYMLYHSLAIDWPREKFMHSHMLPKGIGLLASKQHGANADLPVFVVDNIPDINCIADMSAMAYLFPLYRYDDEMGEMKRRENFSEEFRRWINAEYGEGHTPENIFGCIYATLHSPNYRKKYADSLRATFPRIPFPESKSEFKRLAAIGGQLVDAHLLRAHCIGKYGKLGGEGDSANVEKVRYDRKAGRLYFNQTEYFAPLPPDIFNFQIGGYQPLDKFLKARHGRELSPDEIETIEKAANAIAFTIKQTGKIDS